MGYLDDHPSFHQQLLLVRGDSLCLVPDEHGAWALPALAGDEQHTAEVAPLARHARARLGVEVLVLGSVATEHDAGANRVRQVVLALSGDGEPDAGRFWSRAALAAAPLRDDSRALVARWVAGEITVADDSPWSRPGWHAAALAWVAAAAGPVGAVEQLRVSQSSTVLRVVAGGRARIFKAVAEAAAHEPPVAALLARRSAYVPAVLAVDAARGFLLMDDFAGAPLAAPEDVAMWAAAAYAYGELQRHCLDAVDELRALGCAAASAASLAEPLAALLAAPPPGLDDEAVAALRARLPEITAAAAALDAGPLPPALDHGDLWPENVLVGAGGCAFIDWEDARVAHPFLGLFQLLTGAWLDRRFGDHAAAAARIRDAYLDAWSRWGSRAELRRAFDAAHDVAAVAVAAAYRRQPRAVVDAHPWMREMPAFCLGRILARSS